MEHDNHSQLKVSASSTDPLQSHGQRTPPSGDESSASSSILHDSTEIFESKSMRTSDSADNETPGRPDRSISEYAEAYVKMMEIRESGQSLQGALLTAQEEGVQAPYSSLTSSNGPPLLSPPSMEHSPSSSLGLQSFAQDSREIPLISASTSAISPAQARPSFERLPAPIASSSSVSHREPFDNSTLKSGNGLDTRLLPAGPQRHRRRSSSPFLPDHDLEEPYSDEEETDHGSNQRSPELRGTLRSAGARSRGSRAVPSGSLNGNMKKPISSSNGNSNNGEPRGSQRSWHSRQNSNASNASSGSDPQSSSRKSDSPRDLNVNSGRSIPLAVTAGGITYAPALKRSAGSKPPSSSIKPSKQNEMPTINLSIAKTTLFYIRRRINILRALSILLLIVTLAWTVVSWSFVAIASTASSEERQNKACDDTVRECVYFDHDMTSYLAVSGIWLSAVIFLSICNVMASFMFYWRQLTKITLVLNLCMLAVTVVVLNWVIIIVAFAHEPENWRVASGSNSGPPPSWTPTASTTTFTFDGKNLGSHDLQISSILLCSAVSLSWLLIFFIALILRQLRKFIMSKPRYCCWPIEGVCCTPAQLSRPSRSIGGNLDWSEAEELEHFPQRAPRNGGRRLRISSQVEEATDSLILPTDSRLQHPSQSRRLNPPPQNASPDFSPLLDSLQGIQSTVDSLAKKVQVIEQRESVAAPSGYVDPFAYGRQPPRF